MFHQVQTAISPELPMRRAIETWDQIAARLSEPHRRRRPQIQRIYHAKLGSPQPAHTVASLTS
jgi:hypothetical protein